MVDATNKRGVGGSTALHWAAIRGHRDAVRVLLEEFNADPSIEDSDKFSALRLALDRGFGDVADLLCPEGNAREFEVGTAFIHQRKSKNMRLAKIGILERLNKEDDPFVRFAPLAFLQATLPAAQAK
jgi:ankyrin repeat protein